MKIRRLIRILSLVLALALFVSLAQTYFFRNNKRDELRMDGFRLEDKDSLDVVVIGSSEVYADYSAAYAYDLQGYTSYPYAVASCPVTLWKAMVDEILSRQTPQLIVIEINGALYTKIRWLQNTAAMHYVLDRMPLSQTKIETVSALVREGKDGAETFYLPLIKYHSNWQNPSDLAAVYENVREQNKRGYALLRGVSTTTVIHEPEAALRNLKNDDKQRQMKDLAEQYLREFLEYCRDKELNVLFTNFPHQIEKIKGNELYANYMRSNTAVEIIEEYGFPVLNLERMTDEVGLDMKRDFYNTSHLNIYGQQKVTEYLARYIVENCGVTARTLSPAQQAEWEASAEYYRLYRDYAEELLEAGTDKTISETKKLIATLEKRKNS